MRDRLFFPLLGLVAAGMVALALVWPQGGGAPSPPPFGRPLAATPPAAALASASSSATLRAHTEK